LALTRTIPDTVAPFEGLLADPPDVLRRRKSDSVTDESLGPPVTSEKWRKILKKECGGESRVVFLEKKGLLGGNSMRPGLESSKFREEKVNYRSRL
jgi:hypothetical protein